MTMTKTNIVLYAPLMIGMLPTKSVDVLFFFFFLMTRRPPSSPLFPHPPLSHSRAAPRGPAHVRLLRPRGRPRAHRQDRPARRVCPAPGFDSLPLSGVGPPGRAAPAVCSD